MNTAIALQALAVEVQDNTAIVTINRPEVLNALNRMVLEELGQVFQSLLQEASVKGVILTGAGSKAFVAGADISEIRNLEAGEALGFSAYGQQLFAMIENFPKPVVAVINGFALGGGCELAMACHLRIAAENARFGQPEVNLGLIAGYGGTQRLPRLIGKTKALELLLTGDVIDAVQALQLGLVNAVVPADQALGAAQALLAKCYQKAPLALAYTIEAVNAALNPELNGYQIEATNFARATSSADGKEGTAAFLEKRKPVFTGN
ncbi:MAG: enoyl-CoA hydratase/isomerase family protein [Bacteroidetes bacterium]|nr:enoyl-CoA hydratase/isomerase family protein [Bacteroidota bacterium]